MAQKIDWNLFKQKNSNETEAFEDMCYHLFCRKHNFPDGIKADFNQAGLETFPLKSNNTGEIVGFQSKFFSPSISYSQIKKSIVKAINTFPELQTIYIYINTNSKISSTGAKNIVNEAKKKKVKIEWFTLSNFKIALNQPKNLDLAQLYFGDGEEFEFINNTLPKNKITFLTSSEYLSLPLVDSKNKNVKTIIRESNKVFMISGNPGSGKSLLVQKEFINLAGLDKNSLVKMRSHYMKNEALPILINLKDCANDTIENIIRNRQKDYKLFRGKIGFIYLFDGLDELSEQSTDYALSYLQTILLNSSSTKKIVFSCRKSSINKIKAVTYFPKMVIYNISNLDKSYIDNYFIIKGNSDKTDKLAMLEKENNFFIYEINDILLIKIFWDVIDSLHEKSSVINLIELKILQLLKENKHKKDIDSLNILNPKDEEIIAINEDLSFDYSTKLEYKFSQKELQKSLLKKYTRLNYNGVNKLLDYIASLFFDYSFLKTNGQINYIYQHRRYQEYFFASKLKKEIEKDISILRKRNILIHQDFFFQIFLPYLEDSYTRNSDLEGILELNLMYTYLGLNNKVYGNDNPYISESRYLPQAIASQGIYTLEELLNNEYLNLVNFFHINFKEIKLLYDAGHVNYSKDSYNELNEYNENNDDDDGGLQYEQLEGYYFVKLVIDKEKIEKQLKYIRNEQKPIHYNQTYTGLDEERGITFEEKVYRDFFKVVLKYFPKKRVDIFNLLNNNEIYYFLNLLNKKEWISLLKDDSKLKKRIFDFVKSYNEDIKKGNLSVFFFKKYFEIYFEINEELKTLFYNSLDKLHHEMSFDREINKIVIMLFINPESLDSIQFRTHSLKAGISNYYFIYSSFIDTIKGNMTFENFLIESELASLFYYEGIKKELSRLLAYFFFKTSDKIYRKFSLERLVNSFNNSFDELEFYYSLNILDSSLLNKLQFEDLINTFEINLENWNDDYPSYIDRCLILSSLYAEIDPSKSLTQIKKAINNGVLRHGWRKDIVVYTLLNDSLDIVLENNWLSGENLKNMVYNIFELNLKLFQITDGKGTKWGIPHLISIISKYDMILSKSLLDKILKNDIIYSHIKNNSIKNYILGRINFNIKHLTEVEELMNLLEVEYDYENKIQSDYYNLKVQIYLAFADSKFLIDKEKELAFKKAYKIIKEDERAIINHDSDKKSFNDLCEKHGKNIIVQESDYNKRILLTQTEISKSINKISSFKELESFYSFINDYSEDRKIVVSDRLLWEKIIDKTYEYDNSMASYIKFLKSIHYLKGGHYSDSNDFIVFGVSYSLLKPETKNLILSFIYEEAGISGFLDLIKVCDIQKDKKTGMKLFNRFHRFCKFLVN